MNCLSRRSFLARCAAGAAAGVAGCASGTGNGHRPNVLLITVDDLNDWVGFLGTQPLARTPNFDRLAERGTVFERAYCPAAVCNPSRVSLLTGMNPTTTGIYQNLQRMRDSLPDVVTMPQHFMAHGYEVYSCGKLFHGGLNDPGSWTAHYDKPMDPLPPNRPLNGLTVLKTFDWGPVDAPDEAMGDYQVVSRALGLLAARRAAPLFLGVGLFRPHFPQYVPKKYFDLFPIESIVLPETKADDLDDVPAYARRSIGNGAVHAAVESGNQWKSAVQAYLACIAFADAQVGRLLDALDASPTAANTIVVFLGDNGMHLGEKRHWGKSTLWERATRVPLAVVAPGVTGPQTRCRRTVSLVDLCPTLTELCGLPEMQPLDGASLTPLLRRPDSDWDRPALTVMGPGNYAVRSERWRYIRYEDGSDELYDHDNDPHEWHNLAGDPALAEVSRELARHIPDKAAAPAPILEKTWVPR